MAAAIAAAASTCTDRTEAVHNQTAALPLRHLLVFQECKFERSCSRTVSMSAAGNVSCCVTTLHPKQLTAAEDPPYLQHINPVSSLLLAAVHACVYLCSPGGLAQQEVNSHSNRSAFRIPPVSPDCQPGG